MSTLNSCAFNHVSSGSGGATELVDLTDVNTATPTNRFVLVADGIDWESRLLVEADISDLSDINGMFSAANEGNTLGVQEVTTVAGGLIFNGDSGNNDVLILQNEGASRHNTMKFIHAGSNTAFRNNFQAFQSTGTIAAPGNVGINAMIFDVSAAAWRDAWRTITAVRHMTGSTFTAGVYHSKIEFHTVKSGATSRVVYMTLNGSDLELADYGTGAKTDTAAYDLQITAGGRVMEGGAGMFAAHNDGSTWGVTAASITTDTILTLTDNNYEKFKFFSSSGLGRAVNIGFNPLPRLSLNTSGDSVNLAVTSTVTNANIFGQTTGIRIGGTLNTKVHIYANGALGQVDFPQYGVGTFTGTPAYDMQVQADGQLIEGGAGMFSVGNQSATWAVTESTIDTDTVVKLTAGGDRFRYEHSTNSGRYIGFGFNSLPFFQIQATAGQLLTLRNQGSAATNNLYATGVGIHLGGTSSSVAAISLTGAIGQVDFPQYTSATAFTGTPVASLQVDSSGQVLTGAIPAAIKSYSFSSPSGGSGVFYTGGWYESPTTDANLDEGGTTITLGDANNSYAGHAFIVAAAAGAASGGSGAVIITVTGTSITDAGVRTTTDSETIVADITTMSTDDYFETTKKWLGQITFTLDVGATGHTTYNADFNYGLAKYEDAGNMDFTIISTEIVGRAGASDSGFNVEILHHTSTGWTYAATGFVAGNGVLWDMNTDHGTEQNLVSGEPFSWKRTGLSQAIAASGSEGILVRITTGTNNAVESMDVHIGVNF